MKTRIIIIAALALGVGLGAAADTKEELRAAKISEGFTVAPVAEWVLVGDIAGVRKYDVPFEYQGTFAVAQVKVTDDGGPAETAEVIARLELPAEPAETFSERLTTFLRSMETGGVFAISRESVNETDQTATVLVYVEDTGKVTETRYVVRERAGVFSFKAII